MNEKCKNCKFWEAHQPADRVSEPLGGDCRRNSPIATWPKVNKNDWCGEFVANGTYQAAEPARLRAEIAVLKKEIEELEIEYEQKRTELKREIRRLKENLVRLGLEDIFW